MKNCTGFGIVLWLWLFWAQKKICHLSSLKKLFRSISKVYQLEIYIISLLNLFNPCNVHENFSMGLLAFLCTKNKLFFFFHSPVFKDLVNAEIDHNSRVVVIATSKSHDSLHPSLLTSRGCHIFHCCVELHPPDANQRQEILHAMINKRFPQEDSQELELRWIWISKLIMLSLYSHRVSKIIL